MIGNVILFCIFHEKGPWGIAHFWGSILDPGGPGGFCGIGGSLETSESASIPDLRGPWPPGHGLGSPKSGMLAGILGTQMSPKPRRVLS